LSFVFLQVRVSHLFTALACSTWLFAFLWETREIITLRAMIWVMVWVEVRVRVKFGVVVGVKAT